VGSEGEEEKEKEGWARAGCGCSIISCDSVGAVENVDELDAFLDREGECEDAGEDDNEDEDERSSDWHAVETDPEKRVSASGRVLPEGVEERLCSPLSWVWPFPFSLLVCVCPLCSLSF
jgi:hypothetical protein